MATLSLTLLGDVALQLDGRQLRFARRSGLALLVHLACVGRAQSRSALATLIAGESEEASASMALRNALRDLRAVLGDHIQVDTRSVALAPSLTLASDVMTFDATARAGLEHLSLGTLREAVACYGGELAPGLSLKGAPDFDEWLLHERERLRDLYLRVLEQLAAAEERAGDRVSAIATARRLLAAEPWREEEHRRLMRLLAADGQRAAALHQFEQCRAILQREFGVEPQPETLDLIEQLQSGPVAPPHNLPARPTTFVDRPAERALLAEQLQRPDCRLISIVGIGGAGKTRLALELGAEFTRPALPTEHAFPDGVFFVTCGEADQSGTPSTRRLSLALLHSLNLTLASGANPDEVLLRWLAQRRLLLIIDNAESEPAVAAFAHAVLAAAPQVRLLVTSRLRLRLEAEWVFDMGGLTLPAGVDDLPSSEAGQLFLERARAVRLRNPPAVSDYPHICRICRLVSGLPLGIVLAAGRLRVLSCAQIAEQLAGDLGLLVSEAPDLPERQRNLSAVLRWSYSQLRPDEARCLRLLSVLHGSFDSEMARAVSGCDLALLEVLADYGLLTWGDKRYSLHPLVHRIAAEELARIPDERAQAEERHADHFAQLAADVAGQLARDAAALAPLIACWSELSQAWQWAVARRSHAHLARLRPGVSAVWYAFGTFREGVAQCKQAATALATSEPPHTLNRPDRREIAELLLAAAWLSIHDGETAQALDLLEQTRSFAEHDEDQLIIRIDRLQGNQLYLQTRYLAARPLLEHALGAAIRSDDRGEELAIRSLLARLAWRQGDDALMHTMVAAVGERYRDHEPSLDLIMLWYAEAMLAVETGDLAPARALLGRQLVGANEPDHFQLFFWHEALLVAVASAEGRLAEAEQKMRASVDRAETMGNGFIKAHTLAVLGEVLVAQGALDEADATYALALRVALQLQMPRPRCVALIGRARIAEQRGAFAQARALGDEALQIAREECYSRLERSALFACGRALAGLGASDAAAEAFALARAMDETVGHWVQAAEAAVAEAQLLQLHGELGTARQRIEAHLPLLLGGPLTGMDEPLRTLLSAAETLRAAGDPRAEQLVARARSELARRAELVRPERRAAFLNGIAAHRILQNDGPQVTS